MVNLSSFYRCKRVFVTGHTGFKGSWLCQWLLHLGAEVSGYSDCIATSPSLFKDLGLSERIKNDFRGDIADREKLRAAIEIVQPEIVFHFAAQPIVSTSYQEPWTTYMTNVMGTLSLFDALNTGEISCTAVFITSDKCYENVEQIYSYREDDRLGGHDPYSSSKACAEILLSSMGRSYPKRVFKYATARAGNVIGGGDWAANRIIPDCVRAWQAGKSVLLRSPQATRPWQHVLEPISGYLRLARVLHEKPSLDGQSFNFGPNLSESLDVRSVVDLFSESFIGSKVGYTKEASIGKEAGLLSLDNTKARCVLGWIPVWGPTASIKATSRWYSSYVQGVDAHSLCNRDIEDFAK